MKKFRYVFLGVGLLILFILFKSFGVETTINHIKRIGLSGFLLIVSIFLFNNIILTYGWKILIPQTIPFSKFFKLVLARIAGDSTTSINALGAVAGEPLKALYVKDIIPIKMGLATVVLDRMIHSLANLLMVMTGIFVSFFILNIPVYITIVALIGSLFAFYILLSIMKKQKNSGFVEYVISRLPQWFHIRVMNEKRWEKVKTLDNEIQYVFSSRENLNHFKISLIIHFLAIIISGTLEIYLIVTFVEINSSFKVLHAMFVYIFGFILQTAMFFMPANVGTSEGSYSLALSMLGYNPVLGLSVGIIRRLRSFVWSGIGIILLFYAGLIKKGDKDDNR